MSSSHDDDDTATMASSSPSLRSVRPAPSFENFGPSPAHPLLQEKQAYSNSLSTTSYSINYKPRQRHASVGTSHNTATGSHHQSPISSSFQTATSSTTPRTDSVSEASSRLQSQNLRACLQSLSLSPDSVGWAIFIKLVTVAADPWRPDAWVPIVSACSRQIVSLLLPCDDLRQDTVITPELVADHAIILDQPPSDSSPNNDRQTSFVTLSGLRGIIEGNEVILARKIPSYTEIDSMVSAKNDRKQLSLSNIDLGNFFLQKALLGNVPVAVNMGLELTSPATHRHPRRRLQTANKYIQFPAPTQPQSRSSTISSNNNNSNNSNNLLSGASPSRNDSTPRPISSTLTSLFGGPPRTNNNSSSNNNSNSPPRRQSINASPPSPSDSSSNLSSSSQSSSSTIPILVSTIDKQINCFEASVALSDSLSARIYAGLDPHRDIAEKVVAFAQRFSTVKQTSLNRKNSPSEGNRRGSVDIRANILEHLPTKFIPSSSATTATSDSSKSSTITLAPFSLVHSDIADVASEAQDLYFQIEEIFHTNNSLDDEEETDTNNEKLEGILDLVEDILCTELYDRIFCPPCTSTDAQDDSMLASRIAGLNMLDITLDHLGLDVEHMNQINDDATNATISVRDELEDVVHACGLELEKLGNPDFRSAREKLLVLVQTHTIIAERLARLPPIPMKSSNEAAKVNPNQSNQELEMDENVSTINKNNNKSTLAKVPDIVLSSTSAASADSGNITPTPTTRSVTGAAPLSLSPSPLSNASSSSSSESGADLILPLLIYTVIRSNPNQLVSNLLYIQRFRPESLLKGGQAAYCLVNFSAVTEFLLNVDIDQLGLGTERVLKNPSDNSAMSAAKEALGRATANHSAGPASNLRGRVSQEIDNAVTSAGKVLTGVGGMLDTLGGIVARRTLRVNEGPPGGMKFGAPPEIPRRASSPSLQLSSAASRQETRQRSRSEVDRLDESPTTPNNDDSKTPTTKRSNIIIREKDDNVNQGSNSNRLNLPTFSRRGTGDNPSTPPAQQQQTSFAISPSAYFSSLASAPARRQQQQQKRSESRRSTLSSSVGNEQQQQKSADATATSTTNQNAPPINRLLEIQDAEELRMRDIPLLLSEYKRLATLLDKMNAFASSNTASGSGSTSINSLPFSQSPSPSLFSSSTSNSPKQKVQNLPSDSLHQQQ